LQADAWHINTMFLGMTAVAGTGTTASCTASGFSNRRGHSFRKLLTAALGLLAAGQHRISKSKTWLFMPSGLGASVAAGAAFRGGSVVWVHCAGNVCW